MGTLLDWVMDKPVLLTASGRLARTPRTSPQVNGTHTRVWMELMLDGGMVGRSVVQMRGPEEVDWSAWQHDSIGTRQEDLVRSYLRRFGETGTGRIDAGDPLDLASPWEVRGQFALDPVGNVPGPSAMSIPVGLSPGRLRGMATSTPPAQRRFDADWAAFLRVLQRDLRGQVFLR
jgi:hypothetical protein